MKKWPLFYTILKNSPTMKTGDLLDKLREQVSRTDAYNFLNVYEREGLIVRNTRGLIVLVKKPGFWERRAERRDHEARRIDAEGEIINEIAMFWIKHGRAPTSEEKWKIQEKWGKRYKVEPGDLHPIGV
ncbi:MAG: hypothetical protein JSV12_00905 [Candidatus Bathyarchaeota archaeon]|nr:MAG: hypothetical protein JSV12_00905 [Candidatus Bathyarchaeota archaeon]